MALPFTENFTNTNGTNLSTHNASWVLVTGQHTIDSNQVYPNHGTGTDLPNVHYWSGDTFGADQSASITLATRGSREMGCAIHIDTAGAQNWYAFSCFFSSSVGKKNIRKAVAGTETSLGSSNPATVASGDVYVLATTSGTFSLLRNGSTDPNITFTPDSTYTGGAAGMYSRHQSASSSRGDSLILNGASGGGGGGGGTFPPTPRRFHPMYLLAGR